MTKITDIDKPAMISMRPQIEAALAELGEQLGIKFALGSGSFAGNRASFKLEMTIANAAIQEAAAKAEFERYCGLFDLEPSDYGIIISVNRKDMKLIGFAMNRTKFPIKMLDIASGKHVLLTEMAKHAIIIAARPKAMADA